jgi:hypothetical protein
MLMLMTMTSQAWADGLPDILGIQLGMPVRDAYAKLQAQLPKNEIKVTSTNLPTIDKPVIASFASAPRQNVFPGMEADSVTVDVTLPPNKQSVWRVSRTHSFPDKGIPRGTLLAQLREKYGKETRAFGEGGHPPADDRQIRRLFWFLDEQGHPVKPTPTPNGADPSQVCEGSGPWSGIVESPGWGGVGSPQYQFLNKDFIWSLSNCTAVYVDFSVGAMPELYESMAVYIHSLPMGARAGEATLKWRQDIAEGKHKQDLEKAKQQEKPKL